MIKIPCKYNKKGAWCTNVMIDRSLWGLGARCCVLYPHNSGKCNYQTLNKPPLPPPPPPKRIIAEDITLWFNIKKK